MRVLITGVAGFIGFSLAKELLGKKCQVYGIDNIDKYYSVKYKNLRLNFLKKNKNFFFYKINICDRKKIINFFKNKKFHYIYHFAAQAGVRFSNKYPKKYIDTNIYGYLNILDAIKKKPKYLFYASSSSVYGEQEKLPVIETDKTNPINVYASTKYLNEIISEFYSRTFNINLIGLRFFTVYGEWGRPDMFLFKLFKNFFNKSIFYLNNSGNHKRDFTYINDVVQILIDLMKNKYLKSRKNIIFNVCSNNPVNIKNVIELIKKDYGFIRIKNIKKNKLDIIDTHGNNYLIKKFTTLKKFTSMKKGIKNTFFWYAKHKINKY